MAFTILRLPEVKNLTGLSRSTIYLKMANDDFPKSVRLGARAVGWLSTEIENWLEQQVANSRSQEAK
ncbi:helix-turn-helix transcriptional regulator [Colwellia sp. MEBiC06753]